MNQAHQLIPYQQIMFYKWLSSDEKTNMLNVDVFAKGVKAKVKVNAVSSKLRKELGLDYKHNYKRLFSTPKISGLSRINNGDQFTHAGLRYQVETQTGWFDTAGWDSFVCIEVPTP